MKDECCAQFNPEPWDDKILTWENKRFVKDRVTSILHIPLNFGAVMKRNIGALEAANAIPETMMVLSDENSMWGTDVYIEVTKDIPSARMATISGTSDGQGQELQQIVLLLHDVPKVREEVR